MFCPAVHGDICSICCGTGREVTLDCPLDCEVLREARRHEKALPANPDRFPNQDIRVTERFLRDNESLVVFAGRALLDASLRTAGAIDFDVREALEALLRTYRTLGSGLIYETRPDNPVAARICSLIQEGVAQFRENETKQLGMTRTRDSDVMGVFAFLQRLEIDRNNGRKRGRAYIDFLRGQFPNAESAPGVATAASPLILP
jgi:hypothetical protein